MYTIFLDNSYVTTCQLSLNSCINWLERCSLEHYFDYRKTMPTWSMSKYAQAFFRYLIENINKMICAMKDKYQEKNMTQWKKSTLQIYFELIQWRSMNFTGN